MLLPSLFNDNFATDMFDDMFSMPFTRKRFGNMNAMSCDIKELKDGYQIDVELPGYKKEDVQADISDGYLTIQASRSQSNEEKDKDGKYIRKERYSGSCQRSFYVGENITKEDVDASFKDGVLMIKIPKKETIEKKEEPKLIEIK